MMQRVISHRPSFAGSATLSALILVLVTDLLLLSGCATTDPMDERRIGPARLSLAELQSEVMAFADTYGSLIAQAGGEVAIESDPEHRLAVHRWKTRVGLSTITIAIKPNPVVALIDMMVLATLTRDSLERRLAMDVFRDEEGILLTAARNGERQVWEIGARALAPEYLEELQELIRIWQEEHPNQLHVSYVRFVDFSGGREGTGAAVRTRGSILTLLQLDPLAGLDPAAQELARSRLLAERMFYFAARSPILLDWVSEGFLYRTAAMPESQRLLEQTGRIAEVSRQLTGVSSRIAGVAEQLPATIAMERERAIEQITQGIAEQRAGLASDIGALQQDLMRQVAEEREALLLGFAEQRRDLLAEIDAAQGNLRGTLVEVRETIEAGTELSALLDSTVRAADTLAARLQANRDPDAEPIDMDAVRSAMADASTTARELRGLVDSLDQLLVSPDGGQRFSEIQQTIASAEASGLRVVNRAFILLAVLVGLIFVASVLRAFIRPRGGASA